MSDELSCRMAAIMDHQWIHHGSHCQGITNLIQNKSGHAWFLFISPSDIALLDESVVSSDAPTPLSVIFNLYPLTGITSCLDALKEFHWRQLCPFFIAQIGLHLQVGGCCLIQVKEVRVYDNIQNRTRRA